MSVPAGCIGVNDGEAGAAELQVALPDLDIAREDRAVGAVLHLDPVGGDVDRRVGSRGRGCRTAPDAGATASKGSKARGRKRFTSAI